jgi:hypothetical protein
MDTVMLHWLPHDYSWESAGADDGRLLGDRGRVLAKWPEELLGVVTACRLRGVRLVFEPGPAGAGPRRPVQHEVCDSGFDDEAAAELCKEIAEEHRRRQS